MDVIEISMFENCLLTLGRPVSLLAILQAIKQGRWREEVGRIRRLYNAELKRTGSHEKARQAVEHPKKALQAVTWSGIFSRRANEALIEYSGLICADLDLVGERLAEVREKLKASPYLFALFLSPTADGLKAVFRVPRDASKHFGSFLALQKHVFELAGIQIDESGKDEARLCFVSDDPDLYINPNTQEITPVSKSNQTAQQKKNVEHLGKPSKAEIREMLRFIPKRPEYDDWIKVVAAVGDVVGDTISLADAIGLLCEWSPEEEEGEYAYKLRKGLEHVTVGTLFFLAMQQGWTGPKNPYHSQGAAAAQQFGEEKKKERPDLRGGSVCPSSNAEAQGEVSDAETIKRLAMMSVLDYERCRAAEAEKLGWRVGLLDRLVNAERLLFNPVSDALQGVAVTLKDVEPWPEAVNGADVLKAISDRIGHYMVMPPGAADVCALWCAHTHCFKSFQKSPRLNISAPTEECGKSTLRNCVSLFCARAKRTDNMTTAVMFRLVSGHSATILADECDKWLFTNEELLGLVQSGHEKGGTVMRCEGDSNELREFGCYAPFVLAAIGTLPSQLHGRSIRVRLERARIKEMEERSVFDFEHVEHETELNRKLARFISDNRERIQSCDPKLPAHLFNRIADNWRPLFKIAEAAGGNWPKRCADVLVNLTTREDERENLRVMLLTDIKQVFTLERMFSKDLVEHLTELKERPWPEVCHGKPITQNWLARNLAPFDIRPKNVRVDDVQAKGYEVEDFKDAFERYIPSSPGAGVFHPSHRPNARENAQNASVPKNNVGTDEKDASYIGEWDGGTAKKGGVGPNEHINTDSGGQSGQKPTPATPPEQPKSQPKAAASTASVPVPPAVSPIVGDEFGVGRL